MKLTTLPNGKMLVYVLVYSHQHGTDLSAFTTDELARKAALSLMREFMFSFSEQADEHTQAKLDAAIKADQLGDARSIWYEVLGESFAIEQLTVQE